jgi:hypothetical protein
MVNPCFNGILTFYNFGNIGNVIGVEQTFISNIENPGKKAKYNLKHIDLLTDHFGLSPTAFYRKNL